MVQTVRDWLARAGRTAVDADHSWILLATGVVLVVLALVGSGGMAAVFAILGLAIGAFAAWTTTWRPDWPGLNRAPLATGEKPSRSRSARTVDVSSLWISVIHAMPDPVVAVDRQSLVVAANRVALDNFPSLRIGSPIALASRAPEFAEALADVLTYAETRTVGVVERYPIERRLDIALSPLPGEGVDQPAALIVLRDVSERDRLAQMRADFIAHASHELRTPLAALSGFVETLQGAAKDDPAARDRFLGIMASEARRMTRLLDDLLSLSRVEMRAHLPPSGTVAINETLREVVQSLAPLAASVDVSVKLDTPNDECFVRGDPDEITQVFVNLLQNAIKYGRKGGHVGIAVTEVRAHTLHRLRIAVTDDGPGIAEAHLPRLVERFYRVDDKSSREKGGTGLGLAIVKHIVSRHQGELKIDSRVGHGSTFAVELPMDNANSTIIS